QCSATMVKLTNVRSSNTAFRSYSAGFVAVFIGGTSGIGEATVRSLAANGNKCTVYLVGQSDTAATAMIKECEALSPSQLSCSLGKTSQYSGTWTQFVRISRVKSRK